MKRKLALTLGLVTTAVAVLAVLGAPGDLQVLNEGFEGREVLWVKGTADGTFRESAHKITEDSPHRGQRCELIQLQAEQGTFIHYTFDPGRAPIAEDLNASVWIKANRPGVGFLARVVLPREPNPKRLEEPLTTLIRGEAYTKAGRWQRLDLSRTVKLLADQQQLLRFEYKRDINIADAYVDRLVLNLYGGPGLTEVWIDDLEIAPISKPVPVKPASRDPHADSLAVGKAKIPNQKLLGLVELKHENLLVRGERFFFRAIRHTDTPLSVLRDAGFNTVWFNPHTPLEMVQDATRLGFLIVPSLPLAGAEGEASSEEALGQTVSRFAEQEMVLFWDLGAGGLLQEQAPAVGRVARLVRNADPQRPLAADVWDGFQSYARNVGMVGVHRWPLMTSLELAQYRDWLNQRRDLAQPGSFLWTWVQTHLPDWHTSLVYDRPGAGPAFKEPIGPQPEQIRLLTYIALSAGCRGLGFWSDRFLADSHHGRDRLLAMALLNQELQLLEPLLLAAEAPIWIDTSRPEVKAAVMRTERGVLVLPIWLGPGSQYVPGQAALNQLSMVLPVPQHMEAWEVTPAEVRKVDKAERVLGGTRITLNEFGLTTAIVCTSDNTGPDCLLVYFQKKAQTMRRLAAQWSHDLAQAELAKVLQVHEELEKAGHPLPDGDKLLARVRQSLQTTVNLWNENNFSEAYHEAQRALRPLRILMRAHWDEAVKGLDMAPAVASPYAVSFYTLPRHWQFVDQVRNRQAGANVLPGGGFETPRDQTPPAWLSEMKTLDEVDLSAERIGEEAKEGQQCLRLQIKAKNPEHPPVALERTFLAIHSPAVRLTPGTLVRISAWLRIPRPITASTDGALLYDSAGGEPLAVRVTGVTQWKQVTLFRKVPPSGTISMTLALTGVGTAFFDDVRIEPLQANPASTAGRNAPPGRPGETVLRNP